MFSLCQWHSNLQAAARVLGGGPIYISDTPEELRANPQPLIKRLCMEAPQGPPEGPPWQLLRCISVGQPTEDCIFLDPTKTPVGYKIWNVCTGGFLVGVFGLCIHGVYLLKWLLKGLWCFGMMGLMSLAAFL
ncbi:hypothetical protein, conserved [Eimeria maxima]|uniref:Uncharacterized protein n=1 Tax=Eimeria maxima TaxID=5804 RepID=U6LX93_EIMMA|nr:hypothetical protein, conserved [Eimeria maxima]CDJ56366.1 hypothetical protein, conserved [Eimeria maxima]